MPSPSLALSAGSLILCLLATPAHSTTSSYQLVETWQGNNFLDYFNFHVGSDPTHGYVTYLDKQSAQNAGIVKVTDSGSVYLGVDHTTTLNPSGPGRDSVRIGTKKYYDHSLIVADIEHMPGSICGTWPAFWSVGKVWPADGEIDIIEGVNRQEYNEIVMHTGGTCSLQDKGMTGTVNATGCGEALGTVGCVVDGGKGSYGTSFNRQGGGVYAMQWTAKAVKIWFFPRPSIPSSIAKGKPDPSEFGLPMALVEDGCDVATSFKAQSFVFDVTFCGDWAGGVYAESGCPMSNSDGLQSCINHVARNPSAFQQTYWEINSVKVYQTSVEGAASVPEADDPTPSAVPESSVTETHAGASTVESAMATHSAVPVSTAENAPAGGADESTAASAPTSAPSSATTESSSTTTGCATCTHADRSATLYVTSFVTSTATICSETQNSSTAAAAHTAHVDAAASTTNAGAPYDKTPGQTVQSAVSETSVAHPNKLAGTVGGQQNSATHNTLTISEAIPPKSVSGGTAGPGASAEGNSDEAANDHSLSSAPAAIASDSASPHAAPSESPSPGPHNPPVGSSGVPGPLPSLLPSRASRPLIPAHTSQSASSARSSPASSHSGVSPFFTGAANRVSISILSIAVAFALALLA